MIAEPGYNPHSDPQPFQWVYTHISKKRDHQHGMLALTPDNTTVQMFEFYACSPPDGYKSQYMYKGGSLCDYGVSRCTFGMVRSSLHPNLCLTVESLNHYAAPSSKAEDVLQLSPCQSSETGLESQWFSLQDTTVYYYGKKEKSRRELLKADDDKVLEMLPYNPDQYSGGLYTIRLE
ncbi:hypothetical protein MYAM1_003573 [Malassezia yamatoensis]|uniref:Uncharacterized protein n=1 Tax=Malassezia yamatoensis TaxID=253288 RepID=A0AAJ5YUW5_9BASI|nr:hypothetical protein MYAM1_003573 [Malassezia yamatoensis]